MTHFAPRSTAAFAILWLLVGAASCDSKSRGQRQTASSADEDNVSRSAEQASDSDKQASASADATPEPPAPGALARYTADIDGQGTLVAKIETSLGSIECELFDQRAPRTVANFVGLARGKKEWKDPKTGEIQTGAPYYDGVEFHRVIPHFLIQTGDRTGRGTSGPGYTIDDEFHPELRHDQPGVLSMANQGEPDSGGGQWFITQAPAPHLDGRHSVFGRCDNLEVVEGIATSPTGPLNHPKNPPTIRTIEFSREAARSTSKP